MDLGLEIRNKKTEYEVLELKYRAIEAEKLAIERKLETLKREISELEDKRDFVGDKKTERVVDVTNDDDSGEDLVTQLMIENRVLECEKEKAERDFSDLRSKFEALLLWLQENSEPGPGGERFPLAEKSIGSQEKVDLVNASIGSLKAATGSPCNFTPCKPSECLDRKVDYNNTQRVKRRLTFRRENISPSMPAGIVDISESEEKPNDTTCPRSTTEKSFEDSDGEFPIVSRLKRKRASNIVMSDDDDHHHNDDGDDDDDDDDDHIPIDILLNMNGKKTSNAPKGTESDEFGSDSEGESLGGFIVDDDASDESGYSEEGEIDFSNIISNIQRNKRERNDKWVFEGEMLADLAKSPELCMRAVCALYRQQTPEEKSSKETLFRNGIGFSMFDATSGTELAEFLTGGDPFGELQKSVEELMEHDPEAVDRCLHLAKKYSKQLFEMYKRKEDPLFKP